MEFENLLHSESSKDDLEQSPSQARKLSGKRKRCTFVSPSLVLNSFPGISPAVLCQITELDPPTPTDVLNLVPAATSAQIAQFFDTVGGVQPASPTPSSSKIALQAAEDSASLADEFKVSQESAEDTR